LKGATGSFEEEKKKAKGLFLDMRVFVQSSRGKITGGAYWGAALFVSEGGSARSEEKLEKTDSQEVVQNARVWGFQRIRCTDNFPKSI